MINLAPAAGGFRLARHTSNPELADALQAVVPDLFDLEQAKTRLIAHAKTLDEPDVTESVTAQLVDQLLAAKPLPADLVTRYADEQNYRTMWQHTATELGRIMNDLCQRQDEALRGATDRLVRHLNEATRTVVDALRNNPARTLTAEAAATTGQAEQWSEAEHHLARYAHIRQAHGTLINKGTATDSMVTQWPVLFWLANPTEVWADFPEYVRDGGRIMLPPDNFEPERVRWDAAVPPPWPQSTDPREFALWLADTPTAVPWAPTLAQAEQLAASIRKAAPPTGRTPAISLSKYVQMTNGRG